MAEAIPKRNELVQSGVGIAALQTYKINVLENTALKGMFLVSLRGRFNCDLR